jgi:hypothetical protein
MAGPFRDKIYGVLVKVETTSGVDAAPTGALNAVRLSNPATLEYDFMESGDRDDEQTGEATSGCLASHLWPRRDDRLHG